VRLSVQVLRETSKTVTISRGDFEALGRAAEDSDDLAAVAEHEAEEARIGKEAARHNYLTVREVEALLNGESPVKVWRQKRGLSREELIEAAKMQELYLVQIEMGKRPGGLEILRRLSQILRVPVENLSREPGVSRPPSRPGEAPQ